MFSYQIVNVWGWGARPADLCEKRKMKTLLATFDRVLARGRIELLLVSGYSGKELAPSTGLFAAPGEGCVFKELSPLYWRQGSKRRALRLLIIAPTAYRNHKAGRIFYRQPAP
jgi:hypothetical protein